MGGVLGIVGTSLKWLIAAVGLVVWLGGVALGAWAIFDSGNDVVRSGLAVAGLIIAAVLSVLLLWLTKRLTAFLLCLAFGGVALFGALAEQHLFLATLNAPAASEGAAEPAPPPAKEKQAAEQPAARDDRDDSVAALEQKAVRAEEAYLEASQDLARARASSGGPVASAPSAAPGGRAEAEPPILAAPPPPPPAPVAAAPAPRAAERQAQPDADQFKLAELRFNKPSEMELNKSYVVEATIATPGAAAPQGLGDVGPVVTRQTEITRKVRVELVASDFKIEKLHTVDTVLITDKTPGQWSWRVTPTKEGLDRKMLLQVFGVLEWNGLEQGQVLIKTYEEKIPVTVTAMGRATSVARTLVSSWELIAGLAGVLGGVWVFLGNIGKALRGKEKETAA